MDPDTLASLFKALSEPTRVRILALLLEKGELCVCDLVDTLALSQSVISRHLAYLRNNDVVIARREGVWMYYQLSEYAQSELMPLLNFIKQSTRPILICVTHINVKTNALDGIMTIKVAINGFGRMGRLAFRAAWDWPEFEIVHINEKAGDAATAAHLLNFDSVHGRWKHIAGSDDNGLIINGRSISYSQNTTLEETPWHQLSIDIVVECTGKFKSKEALAPYLQQGVKKVVVSAPVKDGTLNIVMGVNDHLYNPGVHDVVTAASCTTNCIAPIVKVIHDSFVIKHGMITTIHDMTNRISSGLASCQGKCFIINPDEYRIGYRYY